MKILKFLRRNKSKTVPFDLRCGSYEPHLPRAVYHKCVLERGHSVLCRCYSGHEWVKR